MPTRETFMPLFDDKFVSSTQNISCYRVKHLNIACNKYALAEYRENQEETHKFK